MSITSITIITTSNLIAYEMPLVAKKLNIQQIIRVLLYTFWRFLFVNFVNIIFIKIRHTEVQEKSSAVAEVFFNCKNAKLFEIFVHNIKLSASNSGYSATVLCSLLYKAYKPNVCK